MSNTQNTKSVSYNINADDLRARYYPKDIITVLCDGKEYRRYTETFETEKVDEYVSFIINEYGATDISII